jgi:hypothetical protein
MKVSTVPGVMIGETVITQLDAEPTVTGLEQTTVVVVEVAAITESGLAKRQSAKKNNVIEKATEVFFMSINFSLPSFPTCVRARRMLYAAV